MYCKRSNKHIPYGEWVQEVIETFRSKKLILRVICLEKASSFKVKDEPSSYTEVTIEPKIKMYYILLG